MIINLILLFLFPLTFLLGIIGEKLGIPKFVFHKYSAYLLFIFLTWHILKKFKTMRIYFGKTKFLKILFYFLIIFYFSIFIFGTFFILSGISSMFF